jgi:chromosome segregation ATPase
MEEHIQNLAREVTRLRASLQREKQRRSAIAESIKQREYEKEEAERKLRLAEYTNARLVQEIETLMEAKVANKVPRGRRSLEPKDDHLPINTNALELESRDGINCSLSLIDGNANANDGDETYVDDAIQEMEATIPQYRATTCVLQTRVSLLTKQLQMAVCECEYLKLQLTKWKSRAQQNETFYAKATAKLHSQEALMYASDQNVQEKVATLEMDLLSWRRRAEIAEQDLSETRRDLQLAQRENAEQKKITSLQKSTIESLEATLKEQQQDIQAALSTASQLQSQKSPNPVFPEMTREVNCEDKNSKKKDKENEFSHQNSSKMATLTKEIAQLRAALSDILQ